MSQTLTSPPAAPVVTRRRPLAELIGLGDGRAPDILLTTGIGLFALVTLPLVVRGCVAVQTGLARALLAGTES